MTNTWADIRYGLRMLGRTKGFAAVAILTLGLGIGANTAIFSVVDAVLLRPLPYPESERLAMIWEDASFASFPRNNPAPANYIDYQKRNRSFGQMAAMRGRRANLTEGGTPEYVLGQGVTANFFTAMRVAPAAGRVFREDEDRPGATVVVISHGLWQRRFGGDPSVVGRTMRMNGEPVTVLGIMPKGFHFPDKQTDYWNPIAFTKQEWARRGSHFLRVVGRLKPNVTMEQAQKDLDDIAGQLQREYPDTNHQIGIWVVPMREQIVGNTRLALFVLLGAAAAVLLIGCANLANLLLARASVRTREMAVRKALGAGQGRLIGQLLTESMLLAGLGGLLGVLLARLSLKLLAHLVPDAMTVHVDLGLDARLMLFALGVSLVTGVVFGMAPAWQAARLSLAEALKQGGRGDVSSRGQGLRNGLVVAEVGLAVVLVVGAGLLIQTLIELRSVNLGFRADRLLMMIVSTQGSRYQKVEQDRTFYAAVTERVRRIPGVEAVAFASNPPLTAIGNTNGYEVEGQKQENDWDALYRAGTVGYLPLIGARVMEGRLLDERDGANAPVAIVVNEHFAKKHFRGGSAVGKHVRYGSSDPWMTIVGVVADLKERGLDLEMKPATYLAQEQNRGKAEYLLVRTQGDPMAALPGVRQAIAAVDPEVPLFAVRTMEQRIDMLMEGREHQMRLLLSFAGLALLLASIGIYGVLSYVVSQRTREIGLRMALGASNGEVLGMILRKGMRLLAIGLVIGVVAALGLGRLIEKLLFGVKPVDLGTFAVTTVTLALAGLAACYLPARRASRVEPTVALRDE